MSQSENNKRIAYLDFVKVLAMFIVTIGHCAQALSCQVFPERFIPNDFFVSIHMPLFMIASGFVLNLDKIRNTPIKTYIYNKFSRLIIPLIVWLAIYSILTISVPSISGAFLIYWYLVALFFSQMIIRLFASCIKNDTLLIIISLLTVLAIPIFQTSHTNFMFPFLIYGYILKKFINKLNVVYVIVFVVIFIALYVFYWGIEHTVYLAPLDVLNLDREMIYSFLLRLAIGISGSTFIFLLTKKFEASSCVQKISKYGKYTLVFYTMTTVINGFTRRVFSFIDYSITSPLLLDVLAITFAYLQMCIIYIFAKKVEGNNLLSKLLLGI